MNEAYAELGYQDQEFGDALQKAIAILLQTPVVEERIRHAMEQAQGEDHHRREEERRARHLGAYRTLECLTQLLHRDLFGGTRGARATVDIRGFGAVGKQNTLFLLDGRRLNDIDLAAIDILRDRERAIPRYNRFRQLMGLPRVETFEALIEVPAGAHEVVGRIVPDDDSFVFQDTVIVDFQASQTHKLRMTAGRSFGSPLSLKAE